jgi:type I restriction enzyme R subunit
MSFYQMLGRGTRIDPPTNKLMFRVYDYTDATRLFGGAFITPPADDGDGGGGGTTPPPPPEPTITVEGFDVHITEAGRFIVADVDGKAMPITVDEYKDRLAAKLIEDVHSLAEFRSRWIDPPLRQELVLSLVTSGYSPTVLRVVEDKQDFDLYDVLAELGWGLSPRTRNERVLAFTYKHEDWIQSLPKETVATIRAIADQFGRGGTEGLENPEIFQTPDVKSAGGLAALKLAGDPAVLFRETKTRMFAA